MKNRCNCLAFKIAISIFLTLLTKPLLAGDSSPRFITTWTASPQAVWQDEFIFPSNIPPFLENQTVRQAVRISMGGDKFRIEMSNAYGSSSVKLGKVTIGIPVSEDEIYEVKHITSVTFNGEDSATILPGASLLSDEIALTLPSLSSIVIAVYVPDKTDIETFHWDGRQTNYIVPGDQTQILTLGHDKYATTARLFISGIFVQKEAGSSVAVLGDSITDGATSSIDDNTRWPDFLAERLNSHNVAVFNAGISGARLLSDGMGSNALSRLYRDVISKPGVSSLIVLLGINDISWPGTLFAPDNERPNLQALIGGFRQLVAQAHLHGISVIVGTLPPFEGALPDTPLNNYYSVEKNLLRLALNDWIRSTKSVDGIIDFEQILKSTEKPNEMAQAYDSGDHLHPGDNGNRAMAYGFDIRMLTSQQKLSARQVGE